MRHVFFCLEESHYMDVQIIAGTFTATVCEKTLCEKIANV